MYANLHGDKETYWLACELVRRDRGRYGEVWGDMGRYGEIAPAFHGGRRGRPRSTEEARDDASDEG